MLADIVEKAERTAGGVTTKTGSCKFCKQAAMRKVLKLTCCIKLFTRYAKALFNRQP